MLVGKLLLQLMQAEFQWPMRPLRKSTQIRKLLVCRDSLVSLQLEFHRLIVESTR